MFITFMQNNSGGYLIQNEDVDLFVIIEGNDLEEILNRAEIIFEDYRVYCPYCGYRWSDDCMDEDDLTTEPMIWDIKAHKFSSKSWKGNIIIYRLDGSKEVIKIKEG